MNAHANRVSAWLDAGGMTTRGAAMAHANGSVSHEKDSARARNNVALNVRRLMAERKLADAEALLAAMDREFNGDVPSYVTVRRMLDPGNAPSVASKPLERVAGFFGVTARDLLADPESEPPATHPTSQSHPVAFAMAQMTDQLDAAIRCDHTEVIAASNDLLASPLSHLYAYLTFYMHAKLPRH